MTNREMLEMLCRGMGELQGSVHNLESRFDDLERKFGDLENKVESLENRLESLENSVDELKCRVDALEDNVKSMNLTLENEIRKNIMIIAEGHMSLDRKLDEALKVEQEKEMTILRVTVLENDMRIVKEQLGITA